MGVEIDVGLVKALDLLHLCLDKVDPLVPKLRCAAGRPENSAIVGVLDDQKKRRAEVVDKLLALCR